MRSRELYPCGDLCEIEGETFRGRQSELRCALPGFPERQWGPTNGAGAYMGRLPILYGPQASEEPPETHDDGCPGAWYRCGFVHSLMPYERSCSGGVYSANPLLDRTDDPLVIEAIQYLERERARARAHYDEKLQ